MKALFLIAISLSLFTTVDPATVRKINAEKSLAEEAFKNGDYKSAIGHYQYLIDSLGVDEDAVKLNLANAYFLASDTANAFRSYQSLANASDNGIILSKANQQLGVMSTQRGKFEEALSYLKQAIKAAPSNNDARYDYEMLKKKLEEQKKQQDKQQQNKDQDKKNQEKKDQQNKEDQKKDQQNQNDKNKDAENKEQQKKEDEERKKQEQQQKEQQEKQQQQKDAKKEEMPNLDREKLQQMKISEEKARMILEAMKNQEKQYLQQQRRKPSQSRDRNKPDW